MFDRLIGNRRPDATVADRVPPGQYLTEKFPVLHYGSVPRADLASWDFKVYGEVDNPFSLTWDEFRVLPRKQVTTDIHCVTRWSKLDTHWEGVAIQTILELAQVRPTATHVVGHAEQGYTANVPLGSSMTTTCSSPTPTMASRSPLTTAIPLRLIVPKKYFWKGPKWIRGLEFLGHDHARLLGALRLPQRRRSLARGAVQRRLTVSSMTARSQRVRLRTG